MNEMMTDVPAHVPPQLVRQWDLLSNTGIHFETLPFEAIDKARDASPPIFYAPLPGYKRKGCWYITRQEDFRTILTNPVVFSSVDVTGFSDLVGEKFPMLPLEVDPPQHAKYRQLMGRFFDPRRVQQMADDVRASAVARIDALRVAGGCEFNKEFGQPFPILIVLNLMGLPAERIGEFTGWVGKVLHAPELDAKQEGAKAIHGYLRQLIEERKKNPGSDIISAFTQSEIDGRKLDDDELLGMSWILLSGGLDTVASALGFQFNYLATHPEVQRELRANPERIPAVVEEFMRAFSVTATLRRVAQDTEVGGVQMRAGDFIILPGAFGGRDDESTPNARTVDIHRPSSRHVAFGGGPHMCLGMHLARLEMKIAIEEWLTRIPEFSWDRSKPFRVHAGGVFGIDEMHLRWSV